jgi:putative DNA primase/helicase
MMGLSTKARGRWHQIMPELGIDARFLKKKNGPCPMCGGKDRWRFSDLGGNGTWWCNHCGGGGGVALAMQYTGLPFKEVARRIETIIGDAPVALPRTERSEESTRAALNVLWRSGGPIQVDDPVDRWLHARGVGMQNYPSCLRTSMRLRHSGPPVTWHPAMLAMVTDPNGKPAQIHRTYLTIDGAKASVDKVRMFCAGSIPPGGAVRLAPASQTLGVAEGVETSLAVMKSFGVPTWAALSDWGVSNFEPPKDAEHLIIFGDNDSHGAGQRAAYALASRLSGRIRVEVRIPEAPDTDWNDNVVGNG